MHPYHCIMLLIIEIKRAIISMFRMLGPMPSVTFQTVIPGLHDLLYFMRPYHIKPSGGHYI